MKPPQNLCPIAYSRLVVDVRRLSGQIDFKFRSLSDFAEEADEAAVSANYGQNGGQSQPGPLSLLLRREERFENAVDDFARYADAGVSHGDADIPLQRNARRQPSLFFDQITVSGPDHEPSAGGHRVAGVDAKVHQDLPDLRRVADDAPQVVRNANLKFDVFRKSAIKNSGDVSDQFGRSERDAFAFGAAGEGQDALDQVFAPLRALAHQRQPTAALIIQAPLVQRAEPHQDRRQRAVEVVRQRAGQRPVAFHPLRLQDRRLQALPFNAFSVEAAPNRDGMRAVSATATGRRDAQFYGVFGTIFDEDRIQRDQPLDINNFARRANFARRGIGQSRYLDSPSARAILFDQEPCRL